MSSEELNISSALGSTPSNSRKRKSNSEEDPPVFGKLGTPMPTVKIANTEEWDEWKEREMEKRRWKKYVTSKWDLTESKLPEKSNTHHIPDREKHYEITRKAKEEVNAGLEAINELNFNVGRDKAINIQCNGKNLSKKQTKKFSAAVEKALKELGNPTMEEMMNGSMDEEEARAEAEFSAKFAKKGAGARKRMEEIHKFESIHRFEPWEEYCVEMEERDKHLDISTEHYKKWLMKKIDENKVSENYNTYQLELLSLDRDGLKDSRSLKTMVNGVKNFYRNHMRRSK